MLAVENEHTCNASGGAELATLLSEVALPNCKAVWDPANAHVAGELAYPDGYRAIRKAVVDVHVKDCVRTLVPGEEPWRLLGEGKMDWRGQLAALITDGYDGPLTLEPHPVQPYARKEAAFRSLQNLRRILAVAESEGAQDA